MELIQVKINENKITKRKLECLRMIFAGYIHGANIIDLITIAAFVTNGNNYINIKSKKKFTFGCPGKKDLKRFLMDDFIELAKGNTPTRAHYDIKVKELNSKIESGEITKARDIVTVIKDLTK